MIPIAKPSLGKEEIQAASEVIQSGWITQGPKVKEFEDRFARYVGASYACATSNCTTALHLALLTVGIEPGDQVATVSHSFISTANSIRYCGAQPIFVDIDPDTFNISPQALRNTLVTNNIKAILVVHQVGMPCDLKAILEVANEFNVPVIEDAACAVGSEVSLDEGQTFEKIGKPHGRIACFSFHPRKVLTTGEGGMILTNNSDFDQKARLLRHQGMSVSDVERDQSKSIMFEEYPIQGFNYRLTDIQAAIGIEQLKKIEDIIQRRRQIAKIYQKELADISCLQAPVEPNYARSNWQSYPVKVLEDSPISRDELMQKLLDQGVATRRGIMNAHQEKPYQNPTHVLPNSEKARDSVILLPLYNDMSDQETQTVINSIKESISLCLQKS